MAPALKVVLLEKTGKLLTKVRISGGGRCNVTHALFDIPALSKKYPRGEHFVKKIFYHFGPQQTINWFAEKGVDLKTESDGRMFPLSNTSDTIVDCLMGAAKKHHVSIQTQSEVKGITKEDNRFLLTIAGRESISADFVCLASGGYPKAAMFQWLHSLGHSIMPPVPSLFTFNLPQHPITALMGVAIKNTEVKIDGTKIAQEGPVLITHWGLSGPAVLKCSAWGAEVLAALQYNFTVTINWLPNFSAVQLAQWFAEARQHSGAKKLENLIPGDLPQRLWSFLLAQSGIGADKRIAEVGAKQQQTLTHNLLQYKATVQGKTTFKEEFVTAGGIATAEVHHQTMMSKKLEGLYFAGEVLNVDGITGGFNFQHAWASGWLAAKDIAAKALG